MRRSGRWPGLALALGVSMGGVGTVSAQVPQEPPIRSEVLTLAGPTRFDWRDGDRLDERLRALGVLDAARLSRQSRRAVHRPRPVPRMPLPPGFVPPEPASVPDTAFEAPLALDTPPVDPLHSFEAIADNNAAIPPDTHGAVGQDELMTTLNTQFRRQDRNGGNLQTLSIYGFWFLAGTTPVSPFDPRVHYDPDPNPAFGGQGRWITVACDAAARPESALLIAVSQTGTPDTWYAWKIPADLANTAASGVWFDYPNVGFNGKWIVVQVNVFSYTDPPTPSTLVESRIYVFDKATLYGGSPGTTRLFSPPVGSFGATQVPAATYDMGATDLHLVQLWNEDSSGLGYLRLYELSGNVGSETLAPLGFVWGPAWSHSAQNRVDFAPQGPACGAEKIQTNDSRIQNVVRRNGRLWATHTVFYPAGGIPTRASVQWWQTETDATLVQRGLVDDPGGSRFYAFPSIAVNKNEDVMLGFSSFAASEPASARYAFRLKTDPLGTMQVPAVLKPGEDCYFKDGGYGANRWGDYSATVVDPTDDTRMWTLQEYAATPTAFDRWGTWWGMLDPTPVISIDDPFVIEGDSGTTAATFDLALSLATSQTVSVSWTTADGSATSADGDFVAASGTVVFAPGEIAKTITVAVNGDTKTEPVESFFVELTLQSPGAATMPDALGAGMIANDDPQPQVSIGDRQVLEGPSGTTPAVFLVTLSNPSSTAVTVNYSAAPGTALIGPVSPDDLNPAGGTLSFAAGVVELQVTVSVLGDSTVEADETFFVNLSSPLPAGVTILKGTGNGLILSDDPAPTFPGVSFLAVVSDGGVSTGRNRIQWLNPVTATAIGIRLRYTSATLPSPCSPPANAGDGSGIDLPFGGSGAKRSYEHASLTVGDVYCYAAFVEYPSSTFSNGATAQGRPFNSSTGKPRWKYFTGLGATTVAPPTVGTDAVLVPSNDNFVHGLTRGGGPNGGVWPTDWKPANLGSPAQARSPIVPFPSGARAFYSTLDGWVHAVDARTGAILWETKIGTALQTGAGGAPAGIFTAFGGPWDYILVGTRQDSNNRFYALDPMNGAVIDSFPGGLGDPVGEMGAVTGMAAVDYANGQVCFGTFLGATDALWCLKLGPPSDALKFTGWAVPNGVVGDIDGSPVVRNGRVYVGTTAGLLWSVSATNPLDRYSHAPTGAPEPIKGFPFPDRGSNALYFSTTTRIHSAVDNGPGDFTQKWLPITGLTSPSPVLYWAAQNRIYVGLASWGGPSGAWLYDINAATGSASPIRLESGSPTAIGAPSLDTGVAPVMLHAGSVAGVIYAVQVP